MNLARMLAQRADENRPIRIGQVGAGKFGTMFLSQLRLTRGMHLAGLADLLPDRARERLTGVGWPAEQIEAASLADALASGKSCVTDDAMSLITNPEIDVIIEATGDPATGIKLCNAAIDHGKHVVMVNVEADALAGPLLARRAAEKGVVYSLAWGDQPALICEQVDWARACGFEVVAAGKGTRYLPDLSPVLDTRHRLGHPRPSTSTSRIAATSTRRCSTPSSMAPSPGIEMTAVCNATGLHAAIRSGLAFPPATRFECAEVCKPKSDGGTSGERPASPR